MSILQRNNVSVFGDGPPMMFVHGFGCDQNMWRRLFPLFAEDHKLILLDLVGSGNSDATAYDFDKYSSLQGYADDICELLQELQCEPVIFVGHSVSAMIGMLANNRCPELFASQIMVGPSPCYINSPDYVGGFERSDIDELLETMENNYLGWASTMAPAIMGAPNEPELGSELVNSFCRTNPEIAKHFARVTFLSDHRQDLAKLHSPTLILQCSDDLIAPVAVGQYMHQKIASSKLHIIKNVGHCPHLSASSETALAIKAFLSHPE